MRQAFLGGMSPRQFLHEYWQKKPMFVRHAFPPAPPLVTPDQLASLSLLEEVRARIVRHGKRGWKLQHGPFTEATFRTLPKTRWTLLVQDVNHWVPAADRLLGQFDFIPRARLDDVMISYAAPMGSVGPHYDSYDVFLIQATGKRRWMLGPQSDHSCIPGLDLKILSNFLPRYDITMEAGDLLYLPPGYAHHGVAIGDCMTYSVGFRAPTAEEVGTQFLNYLQDHLSLEGIYTDPDLNVARCPGRINRELLDSVQAWVGKITWKRTDVTLFLGQFLSEAKPLVFFSRPSRPLSLAAFRTRAAEHGLALHPKTNMLYLLPYFFINGEVLELKRPAPLFTTLANRRILEKTSTIAMHDIHILYQWYLEGFIIFS